MRALPQAKIFAILLIGTVLRFLNLGGQSLWNDEIKSFNYASRSVWEIVTIPFWRDTHQPLYYLVLHFFLPLGNNEAILRLISLIFGVLSIGLFYMILKDFLEENYGLLGALLMAISPFHIWYSQEARPYTMILFLGLLSFYFLQKLVAEKSRRYRIAFVFSAAATYFCHSIALPYLFFLMLYAFWADDKSGMKYWGWTFATVFLIISPTFLPLILSPPSHSADAFRDVNLTQVGYIFWAFSTGYTLGPSLVDLHYVSLGEVLHQYFLLILSVVGLFGALLLTGFYILWRRDKQKCILTVLWLFMPIIFVLVGALLSNHPINVRYVILAFPAFLIMLIVGLTEIRYKWLFLSVFSCLILINSYSLFNNFYKPKYQREDNRSAAKFLTTSVQKEDLIIVSAGYTVKNLKHYYAGAATMVAYPPETRYVNGQSIAQELKEIISQRRRFWLVLSRTYHSDPKGLIRKHCDLNYKRLKHGSWNGVEVILYSNKP